MALLNQVRMALERHPSFARNIGLQILPPPEVPKSERLIRRPSRACGRHTFYTLIVIALVGVSSQLVVLSRQNQQQTQVVTSVVREFEQTKGSWINKLAASQWTIQGGLIAFNLVMAFRGVQIWNIIQRVKVIDTVQRLHWVDPATRYVARVLSPITSPIRLAIKPFALRKARLAKRAVGDAALLTKADRHSKRAARAFEPLARATSKMGASAYARANAYARGWWALGRFVSG